MTVLRRALIGVMGIAAVVGLVQPAAAANAEAPVRSVPAGAASTCAEFAAQTAGGREDWACIRGVVTTYGPRGDSTVMKLASTNVDGGTLATPQVVASDYLSNVTETIYASISGVSYRIPMTVRTTLYNHSADVKMSYTSSRAISVIWSLRIRRDNTLSGDDTVFTYPEAQGSESAKTSFSTLESAYGDGYNALPYDGKKYFYDLYAIRLYASGKVLHAAGSVQSDRMTCYKTVSCKFK